MQEYRYIRTADKRIAIFCWPNKKRGKSANEIRVDSPSFNDEELRILTRLVFLYRKALAQINNTGWVLRFVFSVETSERVIAHQGRHLSMESLLDML